MNTEHEIWQHIHEVRKKLRVVVSELLSRAEQHDQSKLQDPELPMFKEYTPKLKDTTYGSDEYKGYLVEMGKALEHHYSENRHHPEHHITGVDGMNLIDLLEMLCDWWAATKKHADGDIEKSITQNAGRFDYGDQLERILRNTVYYMEKLEHGHS